MRKNKKDLNAYENDMVNISNKEQEILESYNEDFIEYDEKVNYDDEEFDYKEEVIEEEKVVVEKQRKSPSKYFDTVYNDIPDWQELFTKGNVTPVLEEVKESNIKHVYSFPYFSCGCAACKAAYKPSATSSLLPSPICSSSLLPSSRTKISF